MSSQLSSSTTTTKKRKLVASDADEFVLKRKQEVTVSTTVSFSIPDFLKEINDESTKKLSIKSPAFEIGNKKFVFDIYPEIIPGYSSFGIDVDSKDVILSGEWKETPLRQPPRPFSNNHLKTESASVPRCCAMSHDEYKQWAKIHGDVLSLKVTLTLHLQENYTTLHQRLLD